MSNQDQDFEKELRMALRREEPPADFAAKVLARAKESKTAEERPKVVEMPVWRRPLVWAVAAGLAVTALVPPAVQQYQQRRQEERAMKAEKELLFALSITRAKLQHTREKIQRSTRQPL